MHRTLRSQVQELSALPIVGLTVVAIGASVLLTRERVSYEAERNLVSISNLLCSMTRERQESLASQTKLFTDLGAVKNAVAAGNRTALGERANVFITDSAADSLLLFDAKGRLIQDAGMKPGKPAASLQRLLDSAARGAPASSIVLQSGKLYCASAMPMIYGNGQVGAAASLSLIGDDFARQLSVDSSAEVMFVAGGKALGSSIKDVNPPNLVGHEIERLNLGRDEYVALSSPFPGSEPGAALSLVSLRKFDELAAPFRSVSDTFIFLVVGALLAALLLARAFAETISKPLDQLVVKATALRDGEWPEPIVVERTDEVGLLQTVFNDMAAELRSSQEKLLALVDTDPLTGLDNHRCFKERLEHEVFRATMSKKHLVLVLLDLDKFQAYNSEFGHLKGDEALKTIAELLNDVAPDIAFLARHGGEEFAMVLPLSSLENAEDIVARLRVQVDQKFDKRLTFSAGIADVGPAVNTGAGLFLCAEFAMSRAKKFGRSQVCRFDVMSTAVNSEDPLQLQMFLQDTTFSTIQALAGAVDAKDPYTQGHSLRVAQLASDLARFMGHPKTFVELVYKTATLHDVGKIGVPDSILTKNSRLDPEEWSIMETHPVLGELIVRKAPQLGDMLPGVRHHHERWDGKGYPDQMKGIQIPLLARIISVADTYDAMTSDRPYRRALPNDVALAEIRKQSGAQFDPELVEAFLRMMQMNGSRQLRAA